MPIQLEGSGQILWMTKIYGKSWILSPVGINSSAESL